MRTLTGAINEALSGRKYLNEEHSPYDVTIGGKNPIADIDFSDATFQDFINFCEWIGLKTKAIQKVVLSEYKATDSMEDIDAEMEGELRPIYAKMSRQRIKPKFVSDWLADMGDAGVDLFDAWEDWRNQS